MQRTKKTLDQETQIIEHLDRIIELLEQLVPTSNTRYLAESVKLQSRNK